MLAFLPLLACVSDVPDDARTAWVRDVLTRDNAPWLSRDPDLLAAKYARMAEDPYDFMRGSLSVFLADASAPHAGRSRTTFLDAPEAAAVLVAGDPHPENVSTMLPGGDATRPAVLELVDLDGAAFGPWTVDVRRGALGLLVRYDHFDADSKADGGATDMVIAGVTHDWREKVSTAVTYERTTPEGGDPAHGVVVHLQAGY